MLKALQQLNVEPVVLLKKINVNEERIKIATQSSLLASDSSEGDAMQRYQHLPTKSSDPRDPPTPSSSLNLRINLKGDPVKLCIPSCHKRKASLEEAFTEADSAYTEKSKKFRSDHSSDGDKKKSSYVEELKQVEGKKPSESDKDKVKKLKLSEKERSSKSDHQPDNTNSQGGSVSSSHSSHKRDKKTKDKKKKKYRDRSDKSPSSDKTSKNRSRHSSRADSRKQSDTGDGSHSEEELIPPSNQNHDISLSISVPEAAVQDDDDITDEEVFNESKNSKSPIAEFNAEVTSEPPRSDSALTVALEVEMISDDHHLAPVNVVDLASPVKSPLPQNSAIEPLSDGGSNLHVKIVDSQNSNTKPKETQNNGIEISTNGIVAAESPQKVETISKSNDLETCIVNNISSTTVHDDEDKPTKGADEQIDLSQTSTETIKPRAETQSASPPVPEDISMDTVGSLTEKPTEMKTNFPISPLPTAVQSETMETTLSPDLLTSHDLSSLETPHREEQDAISKASVAVSETKMCGCIPIDTSLLELKRLEAEIQQEQDEIKLLLSESVKERKSLCQELKSLNSMVEGQKQDVATRQESISIQSQSTATLLEEVDRLRDDRAQIMVQRKNSHQTMLKTEFKLRELQLELCRKQLTEPDIRMDPTNPLYVSIQDDEKQVIELTEDIAKKSAVHKQLESMCQKTEEEFYKKNEEYQVLSKQLDDARKIWESLQQDVDKVEKKISSITNRLKLLADERKQKNVRVLEMEEELIYIEMCKKLKEVDEKKLLLLVSTGEEDFPVDESSPSHSPIPTQKIPEVVEDTNVSFVTTNVERAERVASVIVNSPLISPGLNSLVTTEESVVSNILSKAVESVVADEVEAEAEMESESEPMEEENSGTESPQNQPMCLRMTSAVSSPPPMEMTTPSTDLTNGSDAPSSTTTMIVQPPPVSNSPPSTKVVDSLSRAEASQASPSQSLPTAAIAQSQDQISLSSLEIALPFYAQILNSSSGAKANQNDEKILCQDIVIGVRNFNTWFTKYQTALSSLDPKALQQSAVYMKEYFVPFYRLLAARNTNVNTNVNTNANISASSLMDSIVITAQRSEWYGMAPVDSTYMRQLLESNLRLAIDHGTKQLKKAPPSRVEFCPSSGAQSLPTFTIHPPATANESFRSSTLANHSPSPRNHVERLTPERPQPVVVAATDSSPMGALNSMINSHARQSHNQPIVPSLSGEPAVPGTNGYMVADAHSGMARQNWSASPMTNGMGPYQPQPIQNTAIVAPMQYTSRHRMQNVPPNVSPINPWHQMTTNSGAQQYMGNNMMQPNSSRMPISPYAPMAPQFYRQPQQQTHFIPSNYQQGDPTLQQQQHQHQMAGFVNAENSPRQMPRVGGVQMQSPSSSQRPKQHGTPQLPATLQHPQHTGGGQQQQPQHQQTQQQIAHQNHHIAQQQQRHMPQPSPPATNVQQRHFSGPQLEATRQASTRSHSQEQQAIPQQQVQVQLPMQGQTPPYVCSKCGEEAHQKCSGCQSAFYCSRDCQVAHWEEHGKICSRQV